ncbi:MAG: lyase family protein, partial [Candidatus Nitrosocosmicus sp.]
LKSLSCALMKIANDIRWLASGPRCGIAEIRIPEKEPGSSIMPGKVNPTQCEAMTMICCQVIGNDMAIGMAGSQGNFELNVYKPVITFNILQSIQLLSDVCNSFCDFCINDTEYEKTSSKGPKGLEPDVERMNNLVSNSLMLVTALKSKIGYDKAAKIAKKAFEEQITLKQATVQLGFLSEKEYDYIVNPKDMVHPTRY